MRAASRAVDPCRITDARYRERSLRITDAYRERLQALSDRIGAYTVQRWQTVTAEDLDRSHAAWLAQTVAALGQSQRASVNLTSAYLIAYLASELGRPASVGAPSAAVFGAADGQPLDVPLSKTLIGVKAAIKEGASTRRGARRPAAPRGTARRERPARRAAPRARRADRHAPADHRLAARHPRRVRRVPRRRRGAAGQADPFQGARPLSLHRRADRR
jgi:hypothetical protein